MADWNLKKVILVDNDSEFDEQLTRRLRERGYEPMVLRRGADAVKTVKDTKPGAVVLELTLPDRDGRQVLKEIKDDWDAKIVPVIVTSNYVNRLDATGRQNAEAVLSKPVDWDQLLHQIQAACNKKRD
ncbi:MAG TPA: response regulator [Thermomicrobiaceae bacterium]|nr:response regulator [Thermomicrobiaceae bacterium]